MYYRIYIFIDQKLDDFETIETYVDINDKLYFTPYLYIGKGCGCKIRTLVILPILMLAS